MRIIVGTLALALIFASAAYAAAPLAIYKGKSRVLVVSAPSAADPGLAMQNRWLRAREPGLRERDLVVIRVVGRVVEGASKPHQDARALRAATGLSVDRFGVALIGKDGVEALIRDEPVKMVTLFGTIDAMPMRREEMARRRPRTAA